MHHDPNTAGGRRKNNSPGPGSDRPPSSGNPTVARGSSWPGPSPKTAKGPSRLGHDPDAVAAAGWSACSTECTPAARNHLLSAADPILGLSRFPATDRWPRSRHCRCCFAPQTGAPVAHGIAPQRAPSKMRFAWRFLSTKSHGRPPPFSGWPTNPISLFVSFLPSFSF